MSAQSWQGQWAPKVSRFELHPHGTLKKVVPKTIQVTTLYFSHYEVMEGNPGAISMYDTMKMETNWLHRDNDAYATVKYFPS